MIDCGGERTLISAIVPPKTTHTNGLLGIAFKDPVQMCVLQGSFSSIPYDFYIRVMGKSNFYEDIAGKLPILPNVFQNELVCRVALLNCLTQNYEELWAEIYKEEFKSDSWSKYDVRLSNGVFRDLDKKWHEKYPVRNDYARRQLLVEIDVIVSMSLGMNLEQLQTIYGIQFPVMQQYEADTWYDANGRITFTNNRSLVGVGFDRKEFELNMKDAPAGKKFYRTFMDDTMPGGPVERTIEYVAPFDRCDREQDYETAWKFFEEKYGKIG